MEGDCVEEGLHPSFEAGIVQQRKGNFCQFVATQTDLAHIQPLLSKILQVQVSTTFPV